VQAGLPVQLDLRDAAALRDLVCSVQPDAIIHAAVTERSGDDHADTIRAAAEHVAAVAASALPQPLPLVALSTDLVFDGTAALYTEDSPLAPCANNPYAVAKADMERIIRANAPHALIVRTSLIYDFDAANAQVAWMLRAIERGERLRLYTDQVRCPIWVWNLADALLELVDRGASETLPEVLHVVGPEPVSRYDLGVALLAAQGYDAVRHVDATPAPDSAPKVLHLSTRRAQSTLRNTPLLTLAAARARWAT
jgi:dTDP-4-dehydrorhamnose reductase